MTTLKQLPENLKEIEQKTRFKQVYKQHTMDQLEDKLTEAEVEYHSDDNKAALVWRYMDHNGMDFDDAANDTTKDSEAQPEPTDEAPAVENEAQPEPVEQTEAPTEEQAPTEPTEAPTEPAKEQAPVEQGGSTASRHRYDRYNQGSTNRATDSADQAATTEQAAPEAEHVEVFNTGSYNFYETATGTMVYAKKSTKIYVTARVSAAQILRNIKQHNSNRGNHLHVQN